MKDIKKSQICMLSEEVQNYVHRYILFKSNRKYAL